MGEVKSVLSHREIKIRNGMVGNIQYVKINNLYDDEEGTNHTTFKPAICFFCGKSIKKFKGHDSDSLAVHSLDGNHYNWDPTNKEPSHTGCHMSFHKSGEKHHNFGKHLRREKNA